MNAQTKFAAINFLNLALIVLESEPDSPQAIDLAEEVRTTRDMVENYESLIAFRDEARRLRASDEAAAREAEAAALARDEENRLLGTKPEALTETPEAIAAEIPETETQEN